MAQMGRGPQAYGLSGLYTQNSKLPTVADKVSHGNLERLLLGSSRLPFKSASAHRTIT